MNGEVALVSKVCLMCHLVGQHVLASAWQSPIWVSLCSSVVCSSVSYCYSDRWFLTLRWWW